MLVNSGCSVVAERKDIKGQSVWVLKSNGLVFNFLEEPYRNLFRLQMTAIKKLNERIRHNQPLVDFANQVAGTENLIDMNAMAKLAADEHFKIGRTRLFRWLKYMGVLMANNLPYQQFIDRGYFAVKESVFEVDGGRLHYRGQTEFEAPACVAFRRKEE